MRPEHLALVETSMDDPTPHTRSESDEPRKVVKLPRNVRMERVALAMLFLACAALGALVGWELTR